MQYIPQELLAIYGELVDAKKEESARSAGRHVETWNSERFTKEMPFEKLKLSQGAIRKLMPVLKGLFTMDGGDITDMSELRRFTERGIMVEVEFRASGFSDPGDRVTPPDSDIDTEVQQIILSGDKAEVKLSRQMTEVITRDSGELFDILKDAVE